MTLNKAKGRMFRSVGWTWNPIWGCTHGCGFCWACRLAKRWGKTFEPQFREHFFNDKMPDDGTWVFVGSMGDVFCRGVPSEWIMKLLEFIENCESDNVFLLQTKNPQRFQEFIEILERVKDKVVLGTTLETTWSTPWSVAPPVDSRAEAIWRLKMREFKTFLSLEPLADFMPMTMRRWINMCQPEAVEMGLENYTSFLDPPREDKIKGLIAYITGLGIPLVLKENLAHLDVQSSV